MTKTVCGLFADVSQAENAVRGLVSAGFPREQISMLMQDAKTGTAAPSPGTVLEGDSVIAGMGVGGALGGLAGLLMGLGAVTIPALGLVVVAGPLASALAGVTLGAATGGIVGALSEFGLSPDTANRYAHEVGRGKVLLLVRTDERHAQRGIEILQRYGATNLDTQTSVSGDPNSPGAEADPGAADEQSKGG